VKPPADITARQTPQGWRLEGPGHEAANVFLERLRLRGLAEGSIRTYAFDLSVLLRWLHTQGLQVHEVNRDRYYQFLKDHRDRLKPATLNRLLRLMDRWARPDQPERGERITARQWPRKACPVPHVKEPRTLRRPLTDQQVRQMLQSLRTHRDRAMAGMMWAMGLRIGEVLSLCDGDIDWEHASVLVHGKGSRERSLPLPGVVADLIRRYRDLERPRRSTAAQVFVVMKGPRRGQALTYAGVRRLFRYHRQRLRLPAAHPHRFRHTFAANMIRQGLSVVMLMRLLGHTWITTTLKYIHFDDQELRSHYEKALAR
jgi:site-specific recombinase XerD